MSNHFLSCQCGKQLTIASEDAGIRFACPECQAQITVPEWAIVKTLPQASMEKASEQSPRSSLGPWLIFLGVLKTTSVTVLLPWLHRVYLNEPMPAKYDGWLYAGPVMIFMGIMLTRSEQRQQSGKIKAESKSEGPKPM